MTDDNDKTPGADGANGNGANGNGHNGGRARRPRRVIGTPAPAESHRLLATEEPADDEADDERQGIHPRPEKAANRAEKIVSLCFLIAFLGGVGFIVAYWVLGVGSPEKTRISNIGLGVTLTVALMAIAIGAVVWVRRIMPEYEVVQERHPLSSTADEKKSFAKYFYSNADDSGFTKRPLLRRTMMLAMAPLGLLPIVLLRDTGPMPKQKLRHTAWKSGTRLVIDGTNAPIKAAEFDSPGSIITVIPEGYEDDLDALAKATVLLIKMRPEELELPADRQNWTVDGIIAYSKICTHVGCPAALYEQQTHHILCPCHQSTFDARRAAKVIFGPAGHPLPMLPITVNAEGYLVAQSDFHEPVGPSFWERGSVKS